MSHFSKINPARIVAQCIDILSPRLKEVVVLRFGLYDGNRKTLEAIGKKFGITRERVRQIQNDAFRQMKRTEVVTKIKPLFETLQTHLKMYGGVRKESTLLENDLVAHGSEDLSQPQQKAAVYFAMSLGEAFNRHLETDQWHTFWTNNKNGSQALKKVVAGTVEYFESKKKPIMHEELAEVVSKNLAKHGGFSGRIPENVVNAYIGTMYPIDKNIYGEYGLNYWAEINPSGVRDKAYLVFQKENRPLHFREVTELINKAGFSKKLAHPQTVHNELIKDKRFILVGRGIYALSQWGYQAGTVKEVLTKILKESSKPLTKEEIFKAISGQRIVKPNTVVLNLQNKNLFKRTNDGRFMLA